MTYKRNYLFCFLTLGLMSCAKDNSKPATLDLNGVKIGGLSIAEVNQSTEKIKLETPLVFDKTPQEKVEVQTVSSCLSPTGKKIITKRTRPFSEIKHFELLPAELFYRENFETQTNENTIACSLTAVVRAKDGSTFGALEAVQQISDTGEGLNVKFRTRGNSPSIEQRSQGRRQPGFDEKEIHDVFVDLPSSTTSVNVFCNGSSETTVLSPNNIHLSDIKIPEAKAPHFYNKICRIVALDNKEFITGVSSYFLISKPQPYLDEKFFYITLPHVLHGPEGYRTQINVPFAHLEIKNKSDVDIKFRISKGNFTEAYAYDPKMTWREVVTLPTAFDVVDNGVALPSADEYLLPANSIREIHIEFNTNVICPTQGIHNLYFNFDGISNKRIEYFSLEGEHIQENSLIHLSKYTIPNDLQERQLFMKHDPQIIPLRPPQCSVPHVRGVNH